MDISINYQISNATPSIPTSAQANSEKPIEGIKKTDNHSTHQESNVSAKEQEEDRALMITMKDKTSQTELTAKYYVDKDTNQYVVQFLGKDKSVVKQIPAEFMLELAKYLDKYKGLFVEDKA